MAESEKNRKSTPTALRQRRMRQNDKERGINHLKLRITRAENSLVDAVRAEMSMSRNEATMALFLAAAKDLGIDTKAEKPEITSIKMTKGSDASKLLAELVELSGSSANCVITKALSAYRHSFV